LEAAFFLSDSTGYWAKCRVSRAVVPEGAVQEHTMFWCPFFADFRSTSPGLSPMAVSLYPLPLIFAVVFFLSQRTPPCAPNRQGIQYHHFRDSPLLPKCAPHSVVPFPIGAGQPLGLAYLVPAVLIAGFFFPFSWLEI